MLALQRSRIACAMFVVLSARASMNGHSSGPIDPRLYAGLAGLGHAQAPRPGGEVIPLDKNTKFELVNARIAWVTHQGRPALHLVPPEEHEHDTDQQLIAILVDTDFGDGVIEVDVAGARRDGYAADNQSAHKGHIGLSFRVHGDSAERFYVRPENAILDDQLFRNRSMQYESDPDFSFQRLRQEGPGVFESYAPMQPGVWTKLRIEVSGTKARLYVNGASQPSLIVSDLRNGASRGKIALWTRVSTDAYFSNLRVEKR